MNDVDRWELYVCLNIIHVAFKWSFKIGAYSLLTIINLINISENYPENAGIGNIINSTFVHPYSTSVFMQRKYSKKIKKDGWAVAEC